MLFHARVSSVLVLAEQMETGNEVYTAVVNIGCIQNVCQDE
jgi:hypothetical protein